ncbi:MAG: MATE family efflux transporter [Acidaminococcaceae bacterium]|nr:MATE family efflux transporter [Acidaminococcaceae bacterium]MDD4722848.1 MATE family efflux transporter [Acidaminococcaceae bacterium]
MNEYSKQNAKFKKMTESPVEKLVCSMAIPTIISMLITSLYNMADTFFMGKINASATGAIGVVFSLMALIQATGFFFGQGSGNYISRMLGKKDMKSASIMASVGFFSAFLVSIIFSLLGLVFLTPLATLLGSTPTILPYAEKYMQIILLGLPFMATSLVLNNQLRLQGDAAFGMIGISGGAIINIILDPIFIFYFHMGIAGAALATILSQFISFTALIVCCQRSSSMTIKFSNFKPSWQLYREIANGGFPSLARQGLASITFVVFNNILGFYGDAAIAAISIVQRVNFLAIASLLGFGQGFQPVCGFNYGAKLYKRVTTAYIFCLKVSTVVLFCWSVLGFVFAPEIIAAFCKGNADVLAIGIKALRLQTLSLPFMGVVIITNMLLQNIGAFIGASILAIARQGLFFLPLIVLLTNALGLLGAQIAQPISDFCSFLVAVPFAWKVLKTLKENCPHKETL